MQVEDHASAGGPGGRERTRPEQRVHVVDVDDGGAELVGRGEHVVGPIATAHEGPRGAHPASIAGIALEGRVRDASCAQGGQLQLHRPLLAAREAVAVVDHEHARLAHRAPIPSAGRTRSATTRPTASSLYGRSSSRARST